VSEWLELVVLMLAILVAAAVLSLRRRYSHVKPRRGASDRESGIR
jgi:hypothetical protein